VCLIYVRVGVSLHLRGRPERCLKSHLRREAQLRRCPAQYDSILRPGSTLSRPCPDDSISDSCGQSAPHDTQRPDLQLLRVETEFYFFRETDHRKMLARSHSVVIVSVTYLANAPIQI